MEKKAAFKLLNQMIASAEKQLFEFTVHSQFSIEHKADKTAVTECDKHIDQKLTQLARQANLQVVSEEGEHVVDIVKSGNYITIDPIDGTLGYIEYVNYALEHGGVEKFGNKDLGATADFCLLLGIVEDDLPSYAAVYNYITKEKILLDGTDPKVTVRENNARGYSQPNAVYFDQRFLDDAINRQLQAMAEVSIITQAALGLKSVYTIINPHTEAVTVHRVQSAGLWDVLPAAVAARAYGGQVLDDLGNPLLLTEYITLPGKGATVLKGSKFNSVVEELKKDPQV